jgi:hypothetical protein
VVALPSDARTREQFDWIAEDVTEAGGTATIWLSVPVSAGQEREIAAGMQVARAAEYQAIIAQAEASASGGAERDRMRLMRNLRGELRRVGRRDYFPPAERDRARAAVEALATAELASEVGS